MTTQIQTQLAAQRDHLTSTETVLSEKVAIEHSAGKTSWWSPNDAMTISASVLVFGLIVMVLASRALQKGIPAALVMRLFGMLTIVVMAVFLVVAGYDSQQIAPVTGLLAATVWGTGVCYMWPTMLASASERFPRGGALLIGLMGTAGTLSIKFVLPWMGSIFDTTKIKVAGGEDAFRALTGEKLNEVLGAAAQQSFRMVAILPAILLIVFGAIWLYDRARGGYKAEKIIPGENAAASADK